jgi:Uma2 family endonuclease
MRAPDVAYVARERVHLVPPTGYAPLAPDLVSEILSPDDRPGEVLAKVADWLEAGTRLVWVVDPRRGEAHVHRLDGSLSVVDVEGALDGEQVLPGFTCRLRDVVG